MDSFDDVRYEILEEPEPKQPRPRGRPFASFVTVAVAGALFAGASALASADQREPAGSTPAKATKSDGRGDHGCKKRWRHRDRGSDLGITLRH